MTLKLFQVSVTDKDNEKKNNVSENGSLKPKGTFKALIRKSSKLHFLLSRSVC